MPDGTAAQAAPAHPARRGPLPGLLLPAYGGPSVDALAPALLAPQGRRPGWVPAELAAAQQVVLLVLDGLGWEQLHERRQLVPALAAMDRGPITTVAPTTTATALTSLALGLPPAAHGVVGYKFAVQGPTGREVLNTLRWTTVSGDARSFAVPSQLQPLQAFGGAPVPVVSRGDFRGSGFTQAHQRGVRELPWAVASSIPVLVGQALSEGERFVYAYYEGIDKVAHASGFGPLYDAELVSVGRLVSDLVNVLPRGAALAVTADHGQVEVGQKARPVTPEVSDLAGLMSGEPRFRWLHAREGGETQLLEVARRTYTGEAWVAPREEVLLLGVLGESPRPSVVERLGDVLLVPLGEEAYLDPLDGGDAKLVCRHGGLSSAELLVPLLAHAA